MEFVKLSEKEFESFSLNHHNASFLQTVEYGHLREKYGSKIHYLGVKENNKLVAASLFTELKIFMGKTRFYAPRGFLIDYHNENLLEFFIKELKKYVKKYNCFEIKIDPNVIYRQRNKDGTLMKDDIKDDKTINNLKANGFKHFGFNTDILFTQSRFNYYLNIDKPYEIIYQEFSKSTRKNIENAYSKGVKVKEVTSKEDINKIEQILEATGDRKHFNTRDTKYYLNMQKAFKNKVHFYLAYIDTTLFLESSLSKLNKEKENNQSIILEMERANVGQKLINKKEVSDKLIIKYENEVKLARELSAKKEVAIGALVSLESGKTLLSLNSGILIDYKEFNPKYVLYDAHIKTAYQKNFSLVDFYGISGNFDKKSKDYGIFEFKQGFGGYVVEMVGEFTLALNYTYYIYKYLRDIKRKVKY